MSGTDPNAPPQTAPATEPPPPAESVPPGEHPQGADAGSGGAGYGQPTAEQEVGENPDPSIPAARTASTAGEYVNPANYNDAMLGRPTDAVGGPVAPPAPPPVMDLSATPAAQLSAEGAQSRATAMVGSLKQWMVANPHALKGEAAVVSDFLRDLETKRMARATAESLGRDEGPDETAEHESSGPPPEYYHLADMADQVLNLCDKVEAWATANNYEVPQEIQQLATDLKSKAQSVASQTVMEPPAPVEPAPAEPVPA